MTTYVCNARSAQSPAWLLFYANPHDIRTTPPKHFVNLPISLLAVGLELGVPVSWLAMGFRWLFGFVMLLLVGLVVRNAIATARWRWLTALTLTFGGGHAWFLAASRVGVQNLSASAIREESSQYYWWFLSTYPNLMYPLELFYHGVVFLTVIAVGRHAWHWAAATVFIGWLSSPFVAVQLTPPLFFTLCIASMHAGRHATTRFLRSAVRSVSGRTRIAVASLCTMGILVIAWNYAISIPSDPLLEDFLSKHRSAYSSPLPFISLLKAYGVGLFLLTALLFSRAVRRHFFSNTLFLLVLALLIWSLLLTQHTRLGLFSLQPMHFTRGYIHFCTWFLALAGLQHLFAGHRYETRLFSVAAFLALTLLPDNVAFTLDQLRHPPHRPSLRWGPEEDPVYEYLQNLPPSRKVVAPHWTMGRLVCALTPHRSAFGTDQTTPQHSARKAQIAEFVAKPAVEPEVIAWADVLVLETQPDHVAGSRLGNWEAQTCTQTWCVWQRAQRN